VEKLILENGMDLGDVAMMTGAIRDLHKGHSGKYLTDVRGRWPALWEHNPYLTPLEDKGEGVKHLVVGYPLIQNAQSMHFSDGPRLDLAQQLGVPIPWTSMNPDIHLSDKEKSDNVVHDLLRYSGKYWVLNAGYKKDAPLKCYPFWQEVVDLLKNHIQIVQVGTKNDIHPELHSVFNIVGKTDVRELIRIIYRAEGTLGPISMQFVLAAAFNRPSVIVAGGKEPPRWQMYNYQRYLSVCGCLKCAPGNGCWTAAYESCKSRVGNVPRCFAMIRPEDVARAVMLYYEGGMLTF
jgi:ADP-heptose:LPS heptosyltransferase